MSILPVSNAELTLAALVAGGLLVNWFLRCSGDEVETLAKKVRQEIKKVGVEDPELTESLVKEFFKLTSCLPMQPRDDILWTFTFPIYQFQCYLIERNAIKTVTKKARDIMRAESNVQNK